MSDYFGALLRSAGGLAAPTAAAPGDDIVEQEVDVEAAVPDERVQTRTEPAHEQPTEPRAWPAEAPAVGVPAPPVGIAPPPAAAPPVAAPDARHAVPPAAPSPPREDPALAHPVVRAALRWVAADPQTPTLPAQRAAPVRELPAPPPPAVEAASAAARHVAQPADERRAAAAPRVAPEIELTLPTAPRRHAAAEGAAPRPAMAPARSIDLHIGTIHVAVDAPPPPRTVLQPPAQPAPPPQPPAAERSALSRSRLPRL